MGLQETFKAAAQTAVAAFGNVGKSVTYTSVSGNAVYDPTTGTSVQPTTDYPAIIVIFDSFEAQQINQTTVRSFDQKAMIPVENLSVTPGLDDYLTVNGVRWNVVNSETDPADALWILQVRKP
jgi:hypothetical protein